MRPTPLMLIIFIIATSFTLLVDEEGWTLGQSSEIIRCKVDQPNCSLTGTTNCTCTYNGIVYSPVYDTEAGVGNPAHILKYN